MSRAADKMSSRCAAQGKHSKDTLWTGVEMLDVKDVHTNDSQ